MPRSIGSYRAVALAAAMFSVLPSLTAAPVIAQDCGPGPVTTAEALRGIFPDALERPLHFVVGDWPAMLEPRIETSGAAMGSLSAWVQAAQLAAGWPELQAWGFRLDGTCPSDLLPAVAPLFAADPAAATPGVVGGRDVLLLPILDGDAQAAVLTFDDVIVLAYGEPQDQLAALIAGLRLPAD